MGAALSPDRILRELNELWVSLGKEGQTQPDAGVLRACTMTLVVLAEESEDVSALGETLAALMPEHPARTILIRFRASGEWVLSDRVYAQCWKPFGQRRQICCENIEITASDTALHDVASIVLPLVAPDLPVVLWCRCARLMNLPEFGELAAIALKIVFDSTVAADGRAALRVLGDAAGRGTLIGDLAWTRLTRWREMLAQVFENRAYLARLPGTARIDLTYTPPNEVLAWYMGAWVLDSLAAAGVRPQVNVGRESEAVLRVKLSGEAVNVELVRESDRLLVKVDGSSNCTNLPHPTDYLLMREELGIMRHDPVFEKTLATAVRLAYPVEK
jgi:glucose-6-phosphate dehydrogenase assembly protein OpcA